MSSNGVNTTEDTEMADCDGEKVVTMMDVLQEQQDFEDDANAVLGASDDKDCTFSKGYIKRQAIYACMTCCSEAKEDPSKRAGVCLACSLNCHENHELVELYTKRNFRCDCGNPKFNSHLCQFESNKTDVNEENNYNQNFSGLYCICHRPYPDPESTDEEEMIQCVICEDWLHASHLEATVPAHDQYSEMICKLCMVKNEFLHDYSEFAVNILENDDVDVINDSNITDFTLHNGDSESKTNGNNESSMDEPQTKDGDVDVLVTSKEVGNADTESIRETIAGEESTIETSNVSEKTEQTALLNTETKTEDKKAEIEVSQNDNNVESNSNNEKSLVLDAETSELKDEEESTTDEKSLLMDADTSELKDKEELTTDEQSFVMDAETSELKDKEESTTDKKSSLKDADTSELKDKEESTTDEKSLVMDAETGESKDKEESTNEPDEENEVEQIKTDTRSVDTATEVEKKVDDYEPKEANSNEPNNDMEKEENAEKKQQNNAPDALGSGSDDSTNTKTFPIVNENSSEKKETSEVCVEGEDNKEIEEINKLLEEDIPEDNLEKPDPATDDIVEKMETNVESTEQSNENKEEISETQSESIKESKEIEQKTEVKHVESTSEVQKSAEKEDTSIEPDITEKVTDIEMKADITESMDVATNGTEAANQTESTDVATNGTETAPSGTQETKRKLSIEVDEQAVLTTKKAKLDDDSRSCVRRKGTKRIFKGATFWGSNFRQKLCTCSECISMYKDLSVLFLTDPEDTVTAYEALGKARTDGAPATQYEKGLEALSSLDRIQQINALTEYNKMRDKLIDFLKSFKDRKEVVKEEDIKAFFAGMKPTRDSDGVYFCR